MPTNKDDIFNYLFTQHYPELLRFAERLVHDREEGCDIVSAAFEELWCNIDNLNCDYLRAYLYNVVRNKSINYLRRVGARQRYIEMCIILTDSYTTRDSLAEEDERKHRIRQMLSLLKPPTLEIFRLCYLEQKQYKETADILGISIATVKKHMVRALKIIREGCQR